MVNQLSFYDVEKMRNEVSFESFYDAISLKPWGLSQSGQQKRVLRRIEIEA